MKGMQYLPKAEDIVCLFDNVWDLKENLTSFHCLVEKGLKTIPNYAIRPLKKEAIFAMIWGINDGESTPSCAGGRLFLTII